jgi:hypothetical protein
MPSCLFEGMGKLQHAPLVVVAADDLNADGHPPAVKPAGTEIAGFDMNVMYQQERIQSM